MKNVPHLLEGDNIAIDRAGMEKNGKCAVYRRNEYG